MAPLWLATMRLELRCETRPRPEKLSAPFVQAAKAGDPLAIEAVALAGAVLGKVGTKDGPRASAAREASLYATRVPPFAATHPDTLETAWLRLEWALSLETAGRFAEARPLIDQVIATPETTLAHDAPVRQVAELHRALVSRQLGAESQASPAGMSAESCALVDTRPVPTNLSIISSQFPGEALRWGFEGYVRIAYDIGADGRPAHLRTVVAYPPFIFGPSTEKAAAAFRYIPPTIDGKPAGCLAETQTVNYRIPGR